MTNEKGKYNIKVISTMLGIQPGTLRAWERRYNIIEPIRNDSGHRLYSDEHVAVLRWLLDKVNKGFTIGQAVGLLEKDSERFESNKGFGNEDKIVTIREDIKEYLLRFQETRANQILDEAFSLFSVEKVVLDIFSPLVDEIMEEQKLEIVSKAHEQYSLNYFRNRIGMIFNQLQTDALLPKVITVCGPNEDNEIALLIFTLYLRLKGFQVIYLGTAIPMDNLKKVVSEINPKYLIVSCTTDENLQETFQMIDRINRCDVSLYIGIFGKAITRLSKIKQEEYKKNMIGGSKDKWNEWLMTTRL